MPSRPYRPSGKSEPGAAFRMAALAIVSGAVAGGIEGFVSQWINLLLIFPAALGAVVGAVTASQVEKLKVRAPLLAALLAFAGGAVGQVTVHAAGYLRYRSALVAEMERNRDRFVTEHKEDPEKVRAAQAVDPSNLVDEALEKETGSAGFVGYLKMAAAQGVTIKRVAHSSDHAPTVTGVGTWLLWLAELAIACLVAAAMAYQRAGKPFCELCKRWYAQSVVVAAGSPQKSEWRNTLSALDARDWPGAMTTLGMPTPKGASLLRLERCGNCQEHEPVLFLEVVTGLNTKKAQTARKYRTLLRADEAKSLLEAADAREKTIPTQAEP